MFKYIAILRGINVGGHRKILMSDLKLMFAKMGFENIVTYIQSGNVIFESTKKENTEKLAVRIARQIKSNFDFDVPVILRLEKDFDFIIKNNPYLKKKVAIEQLHVTFLSDIPSKIALAELASIDVTPEEYFISEDNVFIHCSGKYHKSKLSNSFFEKKLNVQATTRNWKTVNKLLELSKK